jgi:hypothetical protein
MEEERIIFILVPPDGLEPPTYALGVRCSIQLSYEGTFPSSNYIKQAPQAPRKQLTVNNSKQLIVSANGSARRHLLTLNL